MTIPNFSSLRPDPHQLVMSESADSLQKIFIHFKCTGVLYICHLAGQGGGPPRGGGGGGLAVKPKVAGCRPVPAPFLSAGVGFMDPGGRSPGGRSPGGRSPGGRSPGGRSPGGRSPGGRSPGGRIPGGRCLGGRSPGGRSPGGRSPGGRSPGGRSPGGRSPGEKMKSGEEFLGWVKSGEDPRNVTHKVLLLLNLSLSPTCMSNQPHLAANGR
jgi:hypothetical protein